MLTVHHLGVSVSERIVWLCEELGLDYALKFYPRAPSGLAPPEYKALHPAHTSPVITDGDLVLAETGAVIEYIIGVHGGGRLSVAPGAPNFADYLFWLHFANASFMPRIQASRMLAYEALDSGRAAMIRERIDEAWALVEQRLGQAPYFAGEALTAADIIMVFSLTTMRRYIAHDISGYPNILAYLQRIGARPAYQRAMQKGDPGMTPLLT